MPDRQRHGRLSDVFARLGVARSRKAPDGRQWAAPARSADGRPGVAGSRSRGDRAWPAEDPHERPLHDPGAGTPSAGPIWPGDPRADTMLLNRSAFLPPTDPAETDRPAWELAVLQGRESDHPDPMADTTRLDRVTQPADPDAGLEPDSSAAAYAHAAVDAAGPAVGRQRLWFVDSALRERRRLAVGVAGLAAVGALLALPPVRAELRDSFTRTPHPYTALYFTSRPQVDGTVLTVPVSVRAVETGTDAYSVRVWTVDSTGHVDDSQNADLKWDGAAMSTVVSMPVNPAAEFVWVSLDGSDQTLHYKIAVA